MSKTKVLIVDDSAAMRALFCDLLEQVKDIEIVGTASDAADARDQIPTAKPDVITLDVEMPGMSGLEFLEEIMGGDNPIPVIMLSSVAQDGTELSAKAIKLGAFDCFPKPLKVTPDAFSKAVGKLGNVVITAASADIEALKRGEGPAAAAGAVTGDTGGAPVEAPAYAWNGTIAALSASAGALDTLREALGDYPANCPATVIALRDQANGAQDFIAELNNALPCQVVAAQDGAELGQGVVHVAADAAKHVVVESSGTAKLRLVNREPVEGARPSADLLFGTMARAKVKSVAAVLAGIGADGAKGLKLLNDAGSQALAQDLSGGDLGKALLEGCKAA